jgi:glucan 1,3-beta-glucosidase
MSMSAAPSSAAHYGPVPSESDDLEHPMPPSTWANSPRAGSPSGYSLPASDFDDGPPRPRFMGAAAAAPGDPAIRDSVASSSFLNQSDAHSADALSHSPDASVYALQEMPPRRTQESRFSTYSQYRDDPADTGASAGSPAPMAEKRAAYAPRAHSKKKLLLLGGGAAALVVIALAVAIPAALLTHKHHSANNAAEAAAGDTVGTGTAGSGSTKTAGGSKHAAIAVTGGDGSTVTTDDGSTFKYANQFGGYWYYDPNDVFNNAAKCNSWTPALNETFNFGSDRIFGVNLGGWLNTEPVSPLCLY